MPLSKYRIRNEYSLADPELYRSADKDDPEALLEGVAMAGLVGVLRQLGDLAEFAAEIFHDLHEEVMATAARGHSLMARVQQLEAEVPSLEKSFFSQTHHSSFFTNGGIDWHPNLRSEQNLVTRGDLPRFIMDSYEECRGPPRLFLLDKFDVAGVGACLKRYTDPSFFKMESASSGTATVEVHKRIRKVKQKKGARPRDGEAPNVVPSHAKLHQLLLEERIENGYSDPARLVKLKKRQLNVSAVDAKDGKSYMEKFLETPSPDRKMVCETSVIPLPVKLLSDDTSETGIKILEISSISHVKNSLGNEGTCLSPKEQELELKPFSEADGQTNGELVKVHEQISAGVTDKTSSAHPKLPDETKLAVNDQKKIEGSLDGYHSDDVTSEVDNYMDALTTMESELETDNEFRPKQSFLNSQKVTDTDGKEEQQTQTQFSDSQSSVDSSTSDEITSFKQDRNEEHTEVQAQLSDSQSTGTSSMSDHNSSLRRDGNEHIGVQLEFSDSQSIGNSFASDENSYFEKDRSYFTHSDSLSTVVENIQLEPILFTSTKYYEPDIEDTPSDQLPQIVELQKTDCGKLVMHNDAPVHQKTTSDSGQASSGSCLMNSGHVLCSDPGLTSPVTLPTGTQSDETPSDPLELDLRLEDDEDRMGLVESIAAEPVSLSLARGDACPVDSSEKNSLDNLDDGDPCVHFDDQLQVSNDLELAHEDESSDHSDTKALLAESSNQNSSRILVGRDTNSQGEGDICPSMEELDLNSGTTLLLDSGDSKEEDCIIATQPNSEDLSPIVEIPPMNCFTGELSSDLTHNNQQDEPESAEIEVLYSDLQSNFEEIPKMVHGNEISGSTCSFDPVGDYGHLKHPFSPNYKRQDNHVMVNDVVTENVKSEDQAVVMVPSADGRDPKDEDCIIATQPNSEHLSSVVEIHPMSCFTGDLSSDLTHDNPSVDSAKNDVRIVSCPASGQISSPSSNLANLQEPLTGSLDSHQTEMGSNEVELTKISRELNTEKRENQLEPMIDITSSDIIYSQMSNLTKLEESLPTFADPHEKDMEVNEAVARESLTELEAQEIVDQPEIASTDVQSNPNRLVPCDLSDSEIYNSIQNSSPKEQFQYCASVDDVKTMPEFSGLDTGQSESIPLGQNDLSQDGKDSLPSPSYNQVESEIHSEMFLQSQVGEQGAEFVLQGEDNLAPEKFQSQQRQMSQLEKESSHGTSEFAPEIYPDESSSSYSLSQTSGQEVNPTKYVMDPLKPLLRDFVPKATENNLDEMPPMPPLPPMQWRMGKVQHASLVSQREVEVSQASFKPMLPIEPDKKSQFGLPISERETLLYQGPVLPVTAVESDELQHSSGLSVGVLGHPVAIPFQFPIMVNAANGQYNYVVLDRTQIQNPFFTLPVVSTGMPPYVVASEGEMVQNSNPCPPIPPAEGTVSGHDSISPQEKQTQPPSQLMTESSSEFKTPKQSVSKVEGEQVDHSISPMPLPSMESMEPNQNLLHSEGEMASSSDTSAQTSDFESEWPNAKPKNKLPRPRNPLIDAVAAHDKSKLRRVTEQVRPQTAPKVDERDSLLEQIRTKSFNLKPAVATRPSIQGPKTNLKVAAILEKANAIRQALAGSDEDDDADSWSDS